jgi:hypothetical protein
VVVLTVGGLIEMKACSTNLESAAIEKLSKDPVLRDQISAKAQQKISAVEEKVRGIEERFGQAETETGRAAVGMTDDLQQIRSMINRVSEELSKSSPSPTPDDGGHGGANR